MSVITTPEKILPLSTTEVLAANETSSASFLTQLVLLTNRSLLVTLRTPAAVIPSLIIGVFFLFIYEASLGGASSFIPGLGNNSYLGFILPLSIISSALSGAGVAGQNMVRDIESGYFDKLLLTPASRGALLLSVMLSSAVVLVFQTGAIMFVGVLMGLQSATGIGGIFTVMGLALLLGIAFAGFNVAIALRTGSSAATQGASFIFFPLTFLTASFVPLDLLSGWLKVAATFNPITYLLNATRAVLNTGWDVEAISGGVAASLILCAVMFTFAYTSLRARTRRK